MRARIHAKRHILLSKNRESSKIDSFVFSIDIFGAQKV